MSVKKTVAVRLELEIVERINVLREEFFSTDMRDHSMSAVVRALLLESLGHYEKRAQRPGRKRAKPKKTKLPAPAKKKKKGKEPDKTPGSQ